VELQESGTPEKSTRRKGGSLKIKTSENGFFENADL